MIHFWHTILFMLLIIPMPLLAQSKVEKWDLNDTVYVSTGPKAYAYHVKLSCARLKKCLEEGHVDSLTRGDARSKGRTPCGTCLKKEQIEYLISKRDKDG